MSADKKRFRASVPDIPPAGPMFTRRLVCGYAGIALLVAGIPLTLGGIAAATTTVGLDAFIDSLVVGLVLGAVAAGLLGFSLRGGRRPTVFVPIGYALLAAYVAAVFWYVALKLFPGLIVDRSMGIMADLAAIFLVFLSPAAVFVWRMVRDPALQRKA